MSGLVLRSDHEPNTVKMKNLIGADSLDLVPLEEAERRAGTKSGFIGPVEFDVPMYADKSLEGAYNLTCGANKEGYHHFGFKPDRDLKQFKGFHDLRMAQRRRRVHALREGHVRGVPRHRGGAGLQARHEVLGVDELRVPRRVGRRAPDGDGLLRHRHHEDDRGRHRAELRRRRHHLAVAGRAVSRASRQPRFGEARDRRGRRIRSKRISKRAGFEVLHDDREGLSPGVKFKDADLLGMPLRLTVGAKGLKDGVVELRDRRTKEVVKMKPEDVLTAVAIARIGRS